MKKHRKIQKKQETELYVQVAEKPENHLPVSAFMSDGILW